MTKPNLGGSNAAESRSTPPAPSAGRILTIVIPIAVIGLAIYWWSKNLDSKARADMASNVVGRMFVSEAIPATGQMAFPDEDHDMVADAPKDPAKLIKPDVLVFSYVAAEDGSAPDDAFKELTAAITAKTSKPVKIVHYKDANEQLAALNKGELHIAGMNTGLVPAAVEREGFVPFCTMGGADGTFGYTMEFIVPAGSSIKKLNDIKGHKVTFTRLDSNSGCKAPLVLLKEQFNLLPERDYRWGFSQGHENSIKRIAAKEKEFEVAAVASDMLARMVEQKEVDPTAFVSIYKSERFPPATIGYVYNLAPELRDGIRETFLKFEWKGTGVEKHFGPEGKEKFVPVNYKDDYANTRRINQVIAEARKGTTPASGT